MAGAVRTPIGKFGGALASLTAAQLGSAASVEALRRSGVAPAQVDEAVIGCARQAGGGPNVARQVAFRAGIPREVPAFTVNMACGSGLKSIDLAYRAVRDGDADVVLAGGTESMSRVPYLLTGARWGYRMGDQTAVDGMYQDGFLCPLAEQVMGETAETLAAQYRIPREEQDGFALRSQQRAARAWDEGRFTAEIVPIDVAATGRAAEPNSLRRGGGGSGGRDGAAPRFEKDEHPRADTTPASLAKLKPAFKETGGTVTAGNSSGITDGAAALVVLAADRAAELGVRPMARLLEKVRLRLEDFDLVEVNEAFAAQVLACDRELRIGPERMNVNGGAIALGHPIGATGVRIAVTLLHEMARRRVRRGLATLCVSGGMGLAAAFEAV